MGSLRRRGQQRDSEVGLDYFGARFYHATHGRMLSVDPLYVGAAYEPQRWNRYAYALNGPLMFVDPDGRHIECSTQQACSESVTVSATPGGNGSGGGIGALPWSSPGWGNGPQGWGKATKNVVKRLLSAVIATAEAPGISSAPANAANIPPPVTDPDGVNGPETRGNVDDGFDFLTEGVAVIATAGGSFGKSALGGAAKAAATVVARDATGKVPRFVSTPNGITDVGRALERIGAGIADPHHNDGSLFKNYDNLLPSGTVYTEWVVRSVSEVGPGASRIVVGGNGSIYFSYDHYRSFTQLMTPKR